MAPCSEVQQEEQRFRRTFEHAPGWLDVDAIYDEWSSLKPRYRVRDRRLPLPVWARRPLTDDGERAWDTLCQDLAAPTPKNTQGRAFCIYLHVPFCASRCYFCDCYAFALRAQRARHVDAYVEHLIQEMRLWSQLEGLRHRRVSTVHLGGGTPTYLGPEAFRRLTDELAQHFDTDSHTEWALESTVADLTDEMLACLAETGFSRLHIGVQSLQDDVRQRIGRRTPAAQLLSTIERTVRMGWVVSVDLIAGLPGQTLAGVLGDVQDLEAAGVDGFSVYELQLSPRNRRFAERHGLASRDRLESYWLMHALSQSLTRQGYRKTLFNHFARERDTNLYFTFPERGEDCLALGTIADGVFGDYHYRHPGYMAYCKSVSKALPGLQGGLRKTASEAHLAPLEVALLSGHLSGPLFAERLGEPAAKDLLERWQRAALVTGGSPHETLHLTTSGSWLVGHMIDELATAFPSSPNRT